MKNPLLLFFCLIVSFAAIGQSSWTQRLNYTYQSGYVNNDSLTGIKFIEISKDGDLYVLASINQDEKESVFKISPDDSAIKWSVQVGFHGE